MTIISISRGTFSGGQELAVRLAKELGYPYLYQEELSEQAGMMSVPVERLRDAMARPPQASERVVIERDHYLACLTMLLCEKALAGNLVYFGHLGHMLLPGVPGIIRVRVQAQDDYRMRAVMDRMQSSRKDAREHIRWVDTTRDKWIKFLYGVDWHDPIHYDLVVNLASISMDDAVDAVRAMTERRSRAVSSVGRQIIEDLLLAARVHFALLGDKATRVPHIRVTAHNGLVTIKYKPRYIEALDHIERVAASVEGVKNVNIVVAEHSLLLIQEAFDQKSDMYRNIARLADQTDAAVDLLTIHTDHGSNEVFIGSEAVHESLASLGGNHRLGDISVFYGSQDNLIYSLPRRDNYRLIVLGNLFLDYPDEMRPRLKDEMKNAMTESLGIPTLNSEELRGQLHFTPRRAIALFGLLVVASALFVGLFAMQEKALAFLTGEGYALQRIGATAVILVFVAVFAYAYGTFSKRILRFFGLD